MTDAMKVVKVNIFGQDYNIKTTADPKYIEEVAEYIDQRMQEVKESGVDATSQQLRIAVLASMNITDELFQHKQNKNILIDKVEARTLAISEFIEAEISKIETENK